MAFRILSKGEKGVNSCKIDGDVVSLQHQTVHPKLAPRATGQRISLNWKFDFTDVTRLELLELAARSLVITFRAPFKNLDEPKESDWDNVTFGVRKWIDDEKRKPVNKVEAVKSVFAQMTPEQKAEFLKSIGVDADVSTDDEDQG